MALITLLFPLLVLNQRGRGNLSLEKENLIPAKEDNFHLVPTDHLPYGFDGLLEVLYLDHLLGWDELLAGFIQS
jgi:hypothetical protein